MGCFNVACTVSHLSINCGDPVVYIPLLPKNWSIRNYPDYKHHLVGNQSGLIYSNCYFNPLTFPIKGQYNDYGGIENVEECANTKAIEKFFGMPIEDFVNSVERNWCREYLSDSKEIAKTFFKHPDLFNNVSDDDLTEDFMTEMDFVKDDKGLYTYKELPYKILVRGDGKTKDGKGRVIEGYHILEKETDKKIKDREHNGFYRNYLLSDLAELSGYYIGISDEYQEKISIMENLSGMFIHGDVYDLLSKGCSRAASGPDEEMLLELGFILDKDKKREDRDDNFYYHPEVEDKEAYVCMGYSPAIFDKDVRDKYYGDWVKSAYELSENYIAKHGVVLDLTPYEKESSSMPPFRKIQKLVQDYKSTKGYSRFDKDVPPEIKELFKKMPYLFGSPLGRTNLRTDGLWAFEDWDYLEDIYADYFEDGSIVEDYCEWVAAKGMMCSANVFFFPAMNGEQHGNDEVSKQVLQKSLDILVERERKYKEENCCPDCGEEACEC